MRVRVRIDRAEKGDSWVLVPSTSGCASYGEMLA
jgi:hypothetical protein